MEDQEFENTPESAVQMVMQGPGLLEYLCAQLADMTQDMQHITFPNFGDVWDVFLYELNLEERLEQIHVKVVQYSRDIDPDDVPGDWTQALPYIAKIWRALKAIVDGNYPTFLHQPLPQQVEDFNTWQRRFLAVIALELRQKLLLHVVPVLTNSVKRIVRQLQLQNIDGDDR